MKFFRRLFGIFVMIAGVIGLVISIAGIVGVWMARPALTQAVGTTVTTLNNSIDTSKQAMVVTEQALGGAVDAVKALQTMLEATAASVSDTKPLLTQINGLMAEQLPSTLTSATDSLRAAQSSAEVLDGAIRSLETFQSLMSGIPLIGGFIETPVSTTSYDPEKPLSETLGDVAANLEGLPEMFTSMSTNLDKADDNLDTIQGSLSSMAGSVNEITTSIESYKSMAGQSQSSMDNLKTLLTNMQKNLPQTLNLVAWALTVFLLWLLAAQIVILSQGWELFQGTADRMR